MTQATRSALMSVATTLAANIDATQDYIPVASTANFSTSVVAEVESTNEVVSFDSITTNLLTNSENLVNASGFWGATRATATKGVTAPDGSSNASSLIPDSNNNTHRLDAFTTTGGSGTDSGLMTTGETYTASIYAKAYGYNFMSLTLDETTNNPVSLNAVFNLSTGVIESSGASILSSTMEDVGDGWYRCSITKAFTMSANPWSNRVLIGVMTSSTIVSYAGDTSSGILCWGAQLEKSTSLTGYLPTTSAALSGLTGVTRGANGTTAASATSGDAIQQLPYALLNVDMPVRLTGLSVSSDGTGAGRLTLCDKVGTHLCDVDIPDTKIFDLTFDGGIIFPNGIYVANSDNLTAYTLYTSGYNSPNLTAGG